MEKIPEAKVESAEEESDLAELALDAGLKGVTFPKPGTVAYSRLWDTCKEYSKEVHLEVAQREADFRESQSRRRQLHNQLCVMILGLEHADVAARDPKDLKRIANLAHLVSGREQYIEEV
ncbi:MAG: hypothetical protein PHV99_03835 [Candidatus Pacebacteria bacterium]|nr:hypothetical protein [Candidatus Paceibacterota bacterium]